MLRIDDERPEPQYFLDQTASGRGELKIFFGAFAGAGKTYAMLLEAKHLRDQGIDIVAGVVETHGRKETAVLLEGIEVVPLKSISHHQHTLKDLDIDQILARCPSIVLIDELAHHNVPGSRHRKRWQDVDELLASGINVFTTLNVQHLESLNDVVGSITKIQVNETIPDRIFNQANEVILVDLLPDDLRQRMKEGKVYLSSQVKWAMDNFFTKGNLTALRELALRCTADCVDEQRKLLPGWNQQRESLYVRDALLVCLGPSPENEKLVRVAMRLAQRLNCPWHVVYVETPKLHELADYTRSKILDVLKLAEQLGAQTATLGDPNTEQALLRYARQHKLGKVLLGRTSKVHWWKWLFRSLVVRMAQLAPDLDYITIQLTSVDKVAKIAPPMAENRSEQLTALFIAGGLCAITTVISYSLSEWLDNINIIMLYMLSTVIVSWRFSQRVTIMAAFINVVCFDLFFVLPYNSLTVNNIQYLLTFAVMLIVGVSIGRLTHSARHQAKISRHREIRTRQLFEVAKALSKARDKQDVMTIACNNMGNNFTNVEIFMKNEKSQSQLFKSELKSYDMAIVGWCFENNKPAGIGTDTLPSSMYYYQPLLGSSGTIGVMVVKPENRRLLMIPEQIRLLNTCALLVAQALERVDFQQQAEHAKIAIETEIMRSTMLSSLSHDLRTPLTVLLNQTEVLHQQLQPYPVLATKSAEVVAQVNKTILLSNNIMDMIRLEANGFTVRLDWQEWSELIIAAINQFPDQDTQINLSIEADMPLVHCDDCLIQRVLVNLLENAFKYAGSEALIEIRASYSGTKFNIVVSDNGPGIELGNELELFDKFYRGNKESNISGLGLGLAICKTIIFAHNGEIGSQNRREGGALFWFNLPYVPVPEIPDDQ